MTTTGSSTVSDMLRVPDLKDWRNEVVSWIGIALAVLPWIADTLNAVDLATRDTIIGSVITILATNFGSTRVSSAKTVAEAG